MYLEWLYEALDACGAPIAMCAYRYVQEGRKPETRPQPERPAPELVTAESYSWMCPSSGGHCWRMLTRKEILQEIRFDLELWYGEDALFFMQEFLKAGKLAFLPCALYDYMVREGSAVKQPSNARIYTAYLAWTKVWRLVQRIKNRKTIDKSNKKRYILFINALKKSAHRFGPSREPGAAENPAGLCGVLSRWSRSSEPCPVSCFRGCPTLPGHQGARELPVQFGWYRGM